MICTFIEKLAPGGLVIVVDAIHSGLILLRVGVLYLKVLFGLDIGGVGRQRLDHRALLWTSLSDRRLRGQSGIYPSKGSPSLWLGPVYSLANICRAMFYISG